RKKLALVLIISISIIFLGALFLRSAFGSTIKKTDIITAVVETGAIENTISASGEILPEFEQVITSPISASIQRVLIEAGSHVNAGQSILLLDKSATQAEYEKLKF